MAKNKYDIRTQDYKTQRTMAKTFAYMLIGWGTLLVITGCLYVYGAITTPGSNSSNMAAIAGASFALIGIVLIVLGARNIVATKAKNKEGEAGGVIMLAFDGGTQTFRVDRNDPSLWRAASAKEPEPQMTLQELSPAEPVPFEKGAGA